MNIEEQIIKVRANNFNKEHFKKLGYNFTPNEYLFIPAKHLPNGSGTKVDVECSRCGKIFKKAWRRYLETKDDVCCNECKTQKMMETSLKKYGNVCSLRNPTIESKMISNNMSKYGYAFPLQDKNIREKCRKSCYENNRGSIVGTSKNQRHICELLNGELNYNIDKYYVDMLLKDNVVCEYDGSGHFLQSKLGIKSIEECIADEKKREEGIINNGYKIIRFINYTDKLPNDEVIIELYLKALNELNTTKIVRINFDNL